MDRRKERSARPGHPAASERGISMPWHLPIGMEAAEMVEPNEVFQRECMADALDPPGKARLFEDVPAVERVAPELAGRTEIVGRNASHNRRSPPLVQSKKLWMRPDIGAVVRDEDR